MDVGTTVMDDEAWEEWQASQSLKPSEEQLAAARAIVEGMEKYRINWPEFWRRHLEQKRSPRGVTYRGTNCC